MHEISEYSWFCDICVLWNDLEMICMTIWPKLMHGLHMWPKYNFKFKHSNQVADVFYKKRYI